MPFLKTNTYILLLIIFVCKISLSKNELPQIKSPFFRVGVIANIGTHVNRVGGFVSTSYSKYDVTGNFQIQFNYNYRSLGPKITSWELQVRANVNYAFGGKQYFYFIPTFSSSLATNRKYHIGYGLTYYLDNIKTTQFTGSMLVRAQNIYITLENDAFIPFKPTDKYRTGAFKVSYIDSVQEFAWQTVLWTGQTKCAKRFYVQNDSTYPSRYGYMDYSGCKYASFSNGISSFNYNRLLPYNEQVASVGVGIDSEKIRNFWQNKVIHDMPFIPKRWNKAKNLHIPMLDSNGNLYLYKKNQIIKKAKPYISLGVNSNESY